MSALTKELRAAAKCAPMWKTIFEAAADEIERLQEPDVDSLPSTKALDARENEIKAEAIREFVGQFEYNKEYPEFCIRRTGEIYATKLERGEL